MNDNSGDINGNTQNEKCHSLESEMESLNRAVSENKDVLNVGGAEIVLLKTRGESTKSEINLGINKAGDSARAKSDSAVGIVSAVERRITEQLILYWQKLRSERAFPDIDDIDKDEISDLLDDCFIVKFEFINSALVHSFKFIGDNISDIAGESIPKEQALSFISNNLASQYSRVFETKKPLIEEAEFKNLNNKTIKYRQILLPIGSEADKVTHILGGVRFKVFS